MNINNVYECAIFRITERKHDIKNDTIHFKFSFFKKTLVYRYDSLHWIDLITKEKYLNNTSLVFGLEEDLYVPSESLTPISELIDLNRTHMTKKGIMKQYHKQTGKRLRRQLTQKKHMGNK